MEIVTIHDFRKLNDYTKQLAKENESILKKYIDEIKTIKDTIVKDNVKYIETFDAKVLSIEKVIEKEIPSIKKTLSKFEDKIKSSEKDIIDKIKTINERHSSNISETLENVSEIKNCFDKRCNKLIDDITSINKKINKIQEHYELLKFDYNQVNTIHFNQLKNESVQHVNLPSESLSIKTNKSESIESSKLKTETLSFNKVPRKETIVNEVVPPVIKNTIKKASNVLPKKKLRKKEVIKKEFVKEVIVEQEKPKEQETVFGKLKNWFKK